TSLIITPNEIEAEALYRDLSLLVPEVSVFPWWGTIPYRGVSPQATIYGHRVTNLMSLYQGKKSIIVTPLRALMTPVPPREFLEEMTISIRTGKEFDPIALERSLQSFGYLRVPKVGVPGEFALRGEVLDVFPPGSEEGVRVVFDFELVEDIRRFDPISQASTDTLEEVTLIPVREVLWTDERIEGLARYLEGKAGADELLEELRATRTCRHEELFFPLSFERAGRLTDYLTDASTLYLVDPERLSSGSEILAKEYADLYVSAKSERTHDGTSARGLLPKPDELLLPYNEIIASRRRKVAFPSIKSPDATNRINVPCVGARSFFGNVAFLKEELGNLIDAGYEVTIFSESESQGARIEHLLREFPVEILPMSVSAGFSLPGLKIMVIQENEIFGRRRRIPASVRKAKSKAIDTFVELAPGDFVVHVNYGIGKFLGIERISAAGTERDYIRLEYAGEEMIFIPIEQVNLIQRYIGQEGREPRLDRMGGKAWENRKAKVRQSVEDLAHRLVDLYARRKTAQGYSFPPDTDWQLEFEAAFPYEETEDQLRCIEEVKSDMESPRPMDRLICGDVGYGKTEVAMRAAFKAVFGGKQAAFLAPTTILTEQHYDTAVERFGRYPVKIAMLSRFVPPAQQKRTIKAVLAGEVDLLIGTHRLLQRDVSFKNLGLLIVDEEQRFGVKDKERLKELRASVDCLTLSATPIPRTLHMSLLKIRDMSLITTPPNNRRPIETFIREYDEEVVAEAIKREIERGGQVFYLHNRVETLEHVKIFLQKLVPEVIVDTAHGQMSSQELEDIMHRFVHLGSQVLVATTIIENGIDIPNVNTIIIDRADMYGISQLYQLRGRVGRSNRIAYAYLLYPGERPLSEIAMKRLQIISDYTELGSGFKI
ncbi:MAG TPA: transcription-repair coupling factor, partial [Spirochaetia bacterium]|nr:transcription-repair coupling factor [Spirochaetia bacterium]